MILRLILIFPLILCGLIGSNNSWAGSNFCFSDSTWLGQSFDWHVGHGYILLNKKGIRKKSLQMFETDQVVEWVSRYGSLTFNQIALDHPVSGMNQAGLIVIASESFGEGAAKAVHRPTLNEFQWAQYQLDNYATVGEVISHVKDSGISSILQEQHYLVCDAASRCAAFEVNISQQELKVYEGADFPIQGLTETGYPEALKRFAAYQSHASPKLQMDPFDPNDRFIFLALKLTSAPNKPREPHNFDQVFSLLSSVKQPGFTQWQIVYDSNNKKINYTTDAARGMGKLDLTLQDFSAESGTQGVDIAESIKNNPHLFTHSENVDLVTQSLTYLGSVLPAGGEEKLKSYPEVTSGFAIRRIPH